MAFFPPSALEVLLNKAADLMLVQCLQKWAFLIAFIRTLIFKFDSSLQFFSNFSSLHPNQFDIMQQGEDVQIPLSEFVP